MGLLSDLQFPVGTEHVSTVSKDSPHCGWEEKLLLASHIYIILLKEFIKELNSYSEVHTPNADMLIKPPIKC